MSGLFSLRLSLQVAACATVITLIVGIPAAYVLARKRFRGKDVLALLLTLPMVLPPTVTGYFLMLLMGKSGLLGKISLALTGHQVGLLFTWYAAVIASFVVSFPLMLITARASMEDVDQELVNASYVLGRSEIQTVLQVVIPLSARGIIAGATLAFARAMGEFGATIMVAGNWPGKTQTMPMAIWSEVQGPGGYRSSLWMVLVFVAVAGVVMYISTRMGRRAVKV
jgi:molybdate transport system permease protein